MFNTLLRAVLYDQLHVHVKIREKIVWICTEWYGQTLSQEINPQIKQVMDLKVDGKQRNGGTEKSWYNYKKNGL